VLAGLRIAHQHGRLTKLNLHLDGRQARYWDPNELGSADHSLGQVMALPTLAELTVSCALIHDTIGFAKPESSNLKTLELIECNVSFEGLRILSAPKALRKLHLSMEASTPSNE
jgi:hypothetical protein